MEGFTYQNMIKKISSSYGFKVCYAQHLLISKIIDFKEGVLSSHSVVQSVPKPIQTTTTVLSFVTLTFSFITDDEG